MRSDDPCSGSEGPWYGLTCNSDGEVVVLELSDNDLSGTIPTEFGQLTSLTAGNNDHYDSGFLFQNSEVKGTIPTELGALTAMKNEL